MRKLTDREHWDSIYKRESSEGHNVSFEAKLEVLAKRMFGKYVQNYSDYFLWEVLFKKYMPKAEGLKVLEVGSAPGTTLVRLHETFGFMPYGVEYSEEGVALNKSVFSANNINPDNVIKADFFSESFQNRYKDYFDIVLSVGFIEHFTEVEDVITKHLNVLKHEGHLIVIIPHLRGINGSLADFFNKGIMALHNTEIMKKKEFSALFDEQQLTSLYCDYYGIFNFGLFNTKKKILNRILFSICKKVQWFLNIMFHIFFGNRGAKPVLFSPYLIYIGIRKAAS